MGRNAGGRRSVWPAAIAAAALVWGMSAGSARGEDWPNWRGPNRDGVSTESAWDPGTGREPSVAWTAQVGTGFSSVSVVGNRVYTMGNDGENDAVWCLDAGTGRTVWARTYPCEPAGGGHPGPRCTPTVDEGRVYTLSNLGHLLCLDAAKGTVVWAKDVRREFSAKPAQWGFACSPVVEGNLVILDLGPVVALEKATGKVAWRSDDYTPSYSTPSVFEYEGRKCLAVFNGFGFVVLNFSDGSEVCRYRWRTSWGVNAATPVISGDTAFVSSGYGKGCARFRPAEGEPVTLWENKNVRNHFNSCVLWEGHLYGFDGQADGSGTVRCLDLETGEVVWSQGGFKTGSLTVAGGKLVVLGDGGVLVLAEASPSGWNELGRVQPLKGKCWTVPVVSGGRIFCRNHKGELVCVGFGGGPAGGEAASAE